MRHDVDVQEYRDFAENLGNYSVGLTNIPVYKMDGTLSGYLDFAMPDFGMVANYGYSTLVAPSYVASARHNTGYQSVGFGKGAQYGATYKLINRNETPSDSDVDFHLPRLNKVVIDAGPIETVEKSEIRKGDTSRYSWYTRIGGGTQSQVSEDQTQQITLSGAYNWVSGGTINAGTVTTPSGSLRAIDYGPDNPLTSPLAIGTMAGDSGSPIMVYDETDRSGRLQGCYTVRLLMISLTAPRVSGNIFRMVTFKALLPLTPLLMLSMSQVTARFSGTTPRSHNTVPPGHGQAWIRPMRQRRPLPPPMQNLMPPKIFASTVLAG